VEDTSTDEPPTNEPIELSTALLPRVSQGWLEAKENTRNLPLRQPYIENDQMNRRENHHHEDGGPVPKKFFTFHC
jgi:hypothetical protein